MRSLMRKASMALSEENRREEAWEEEDKVYKIRPQAN
jgi:hypothetical protein